MYLGRKLSVRWYAPEKEAPLPSAQQAVPTMNPASLIDHQHQPADQLQQVSLLQQLLENLQQQQQTDSVVNAQWPRMGPSASRMPEWSSMPGSWLGNNHIVVRESISMNASCTMLNKNMTMLFLSIPEHHCYHTHLCLQDHTPFLAPPGISEPGALPSALSLSSSLEDETAFTRRHTQPSLGLSSSLSLSLDGLQLINSDPSMAAPLLSSSRLMTKWSPSISAGGAAPTRRQDPIGTRSASRVISSAGGSDADVVKPLRGSPTSSVSVAPGRHANVQQPPGSWSMHSGPVDQAGTLQPAMVFPQLGHNLPLNGPSSFQEDLQKLNLIQLAQEQYACALAQLNSAQSQVLAAAAILQGNGLILPPMMQQHNDGGMACLFNAMSTPFFPTVAQPGGGAGPRRELF